MRQLWRRIRIAILEYKIERKTEQVNALKAKLLGIKLASYTDESQVKRVVSELYRMRDEIDAKDYDEADLVTEYARRNWN